MILVKWFYNTWFGGFGYVFPNLGTFQDDNLIARPSSQLLDRQVRHHVETFGSRYMTFLPLWMHQQSIHKMLKSLYYLYLGTYHQSATVETFMLKITSLKTYYNLHLLLGQPSKCISKNDISKGWVVMPADSVWQWIQRFYNLLYEMGLRGRWQSSI